MAELWSMEYITAVNQGQNDVCYPSYSSPSVSISSSHVRTAKLLQSNSITSNQSSCILVRIKPKEKFAYIKQTMIV